MATDAKGWQTDVRDIRVNSRLVVKGLLLVRENIARSRFAQAFQWAFGALQTGIGVRFGCFEDHYKMRES